jgi:pimeloyl-ACP methyl ester carboxylesterase
MQALLERSPSTPGGAYGTGAALSRETDVVVNDVWFLDDINHGVSVDLNAGRLSSPLSWLDTGKEVVNFIQHVLPGIKNTSDAPWELSWKQDGVADPKVIGVGHSYGASGLVQGAHTRQDLFSALFLVEPMVTFKLINDPEKGYPLTMGATKRRSEWPTREAAKSVRDNALFKSWDDAAFDLWLSHHLALVDPSRPDGPVTLATPTWAEAATFSEPQGPIRGWDKLRDLEMPVGFLMAGDEFWMGGETVANEMVWRPKRVRNERIMEASHLVSLM